MNCAREPRPQAVNLVELDGPVCDTFSPINNYRTHCAILATGLNFSHLNQYLMGVGMGTVATKQDRIGARVPRDVYETLCRAAELTGATVNQFLVQSALKEAQSVIEREQTINLSRRDCERLLDLLEKPPKPNARLKAAVKRYQKAKHSDADTGFNWKP